MIRLATLAILAPLTAHAQLAVFAGDNKVHLAEGQVQLWRLAGTGARITRVATATVGGWSQGAAFSADGTPLIVLNTVERDLSVFGVEGDRLMPTGRIPIPVGPASIAVVPR